MITLQVQEILGDRVRLSHKLVEVSYDADGKWVSKYDTPNGMKVDKSMQALYALTYEFIGY